jgi:hypothetical protein
MKNTIKFFGVIALVAVIGFSMIACDDGGGGGDDNSVSIPKSKGTNEVVGKTLNLSGWRTVVFASTGTTFKEYDSGGLVSEGSYSYNSDSHTITLAIEYLVLWDDETGNSKKMNKTQAKNAVGKDFDAEIARMRANFDEMVLRMAVNELDLDWWDDYYDAGEPGDEDAFLKQWLTQKGYNSATLISQWKNENPSMNTADKYINAMLAEEGYKNLAAAKADYVSRVDEWFAPTTYDYQFTNDGALLVQAKLPANKGSNELSGKIFVSDNGDEKYTFTASDYTRTDTTSDRTTETGTYAYDSTTKRVWLKPEKKYGYSSSSLQTMSEYYTSSSPGNTADSKAGDTNFEFRWYQERYGLTPINWIGYYYDEDSDTIIQ